MWLCVKHADSTWREPISGRNCVVCGQQGKWVEVWVSCIRCRQKDRSDALHLSNHAGVGGAGYCIGQHLRRNHLSYAIKHESADEVRRYLAAFLEVWEHMGDEWRWRDLAAEADDRIARLEHVPDHNAIAASEDAALF